MPDKLKNPGAPQQPKKTENRGAGNRARTDLRLVILLLLIGVLCLAGRSLLFSDGGKKAVVSQDGAVIAEYPLLYDRTVVIRTDSGGSNTLHIAGGEAWVTDATCPDKVCEHMGKISREGEVIVCMPNKLTIRIEE